MDVRINEIHKINSVKLLSYEQQNKFHNFVIFVRVQTFRYNILYKIHGSNS